MRIKTIARPALVSPGIGEGIIDRAVTGAAGTVRSRHPGFSTETRRDLPMTRNVGCDSVVRSLEFTQRKGESHHGDCRINHL
jgi:hypothetical protein